MAVSFANIFMAAVETEIINRSHFKPLTWKRYIDDVFSLWNINKEEINPFIELANSYHPTIKFTAEISDKEITFLDTCVYKGERFKKESILDVRTYFKPTETFQYTHFISCHPPGVKKGFIKGEALRLLRTNSSKATFKENITQLKRRLRRLHSQKLYLAKECRLYKINKKRAKGFCRLLQNIVHLCLILNTERSLTSPQSSLCGKVEEQRMMGREKGKRRRLPPSFSPYPSHLAPPFSVPISPCAVSPV